MHLITDFIGDAIIFFSNYIYGHTGREWRIRFLALTCIPIQITKLFQT